MKLKHLIPIALLVVMPGMASAECSIDGKGEVNIISNFFETLELLANKMKECEGNDVVIDTKMTTGHKEETNKAFAAATSPFDAAAVANSSITLLQAKGQLRPLNDLVEKYRDKYNIEDGMLIKFGDEISWEFSFL